MRQIVLVLAIATAAWAECVARLPTAGLPQSARIVAGLAAAPTDFDNIVTIAEEREGERDYFCIGSLVAPEWVLTAAQCFVLRNTHFVLRGATSLTGTRYEIVDVVQHPGYSNLQTGESVHRDDIKLIRLDRPVQDAIVRLPTPSPSPAPGSQSPPDQSDTNSQSPTNQPLPAANRNFHFMYINNNTDFAMDEPRYLRLKGFGIVTQPHDAAEALLFRSRDLKFADLRTAPCDDSFGNDGKRRLCTERDDQCGACYGDVGAPLYDVDSSGTFSVLVGIVTFGRESTSFVPPVVCTGDRPVAYTAVAQYASWIKETIEERTGEGRVFFFDLPKEGITDTDLARDTSPLAIFATTSVIVISCLALLGTLVTVIITCFVRRLRKKRKRWIEGLEAEDSFVKAGEKDAIIVDPFEGIQNDQQPRFSFTGFPRAAIKGATEFSSRSIGVLKALVARDKDEDLFEPRELIDDAPVWLPGAWDKLFMPPSKKELQKIHKVPTQRVVDDVLSGADKSVELSLEEVAYKAKRDEANLEAAWAKLEIQTSLRNISEAGGSAANQLSPSLMSPSMSPLAASPRKGSRSSSRAMTPLGSGKRKLGDLTMADTLLAAFASIDAESEQVAEETAIDSNALRALAEAKRPKVLATLRRKFSGGATTPSTHSNDRESDGEDLRTYGSVRGEPASSVDSRGPGRLAASGSRLASGRSSRVPTILSSTSGLLSKTSLGSRHSSMLMDYFSEDYTVSNSSSDDDEHIAFEDMFDAKNRRYTEDRKPQAPHESRSMLSFRSMRKSQNRSFESLERNDSSDSLTISQDTEDLDDLSVLPRERSSTEAKDKNAIPGDQRYKNLPISTSSLSSDKRPRSLAGHSEAGPSSQTQTYSELVQRNEELVSVHMEDEESVHAQRSYPDRSVDYQASRVASKTAVSSADKVAGTQRERPRPSTENISVHMEEETSLTGRVNSHGNRGHVPNLELSGADTSKDRTEKLHHGPFDGNGDIASVRMEDASLSTKPISRTKPSPSSDGLHAGASEALARKPQTTPKQDTVAEDRVSVYMEEALSYEVGVDTKGNDNQAVGTRAKKPRPGSERLTGKTPLVVPGDTLSVHMEVETSTSQSIRARINAFDESEKRALRRSAPPLGQAGQESNVSVAKLKNMWNEIARRNSEDSDR